MNGQPSQDDKDKGVTTTVQRPSAAEKKRKRGTVNEIDELFEAAIGKKIKTAVLASETKLPEVAESDLKDVFSAIRAAPSSMDKKHRKKG